MDGTVMRNYDAEAGKEFIEYRLTVGGTLGKPPKIEEVDYFRDHPATARVKNIDGVHEEVSLSLERMAEDFAIEETPKGKLLKLNTAKYEPLIQTGEVYVRNGTYSLRLTLSGMEKL